MDEILHFVEDYPCDSFNHVFPDFRLLTSTHTPGRKVWQGKRSAVHEPSQKPSPRQEKISKILLVHSFFFHGLMNSISWPASSVWVFIAQLVEHCSANAEATGSNPFEGPEKPFFFRATSQLLKLRFNCDGHIFISVHLLYFIRPLVLSGVSRSGEASQCCDEGDVVCL